MSTQTFKTFVDNKYVDYEPKHVIMGDTDSVVMDLSCIYDRSAAIADVTKTGDDIGVIVNDAFSDFLIDTFNIPKKRTSIIETEREIISDKSYFLGKKTYVMHVIDSEGVICDKMKMMGVAMKRSDTPVIIQDLLSELVDMIMDGASFETVETYILDFKEEYESKSIFEIGRPTSVKHMNPHATAGHITAARYYNSLCTPNDIKIRAGDKVKVVYLDDKEHKSIAFPTDLTHLPNFFNDLEINWSRQWETVYNKIEVYLKPIGYDFESRQQAIIDDFVTC